MHCSVSYSMIGYSCNVRVLLQCLGNDSFDALLVSLCNVRVLMNIQAFMYHLGCNVQILMQCLDVDAIFRC